MHAFTFVGERIRTKKITTKKKQVTASGKRCGERKRLCRTG